MSQDKILGDGRYKVGRALGHGGFSVVYACTEVETGEEYAVKVLNKEKVRNAKMEEAFERECMALRRMHNCPYITNAKEILQSTRNYYVIMDLADRGSLLQKIVTTNGGRGLNPAAVRRYFTQLMLGVRDMHSVEIVHRDIKPENLLLDARMNLHISDFGFAARADTSRYLKRQCGTPQYVAPEVIKGLPYIGQYADIWSCGVTLYVMLCGHLPFAAPDNERLYEQILQGRYRPPRRGDGMPEVPIAALHLLACCLAMDPTKRWSAEQLLKHPYLEGSDDIILVDPKGVDPLGMLNGSFCDAAYTPPEFVPSEACDLVPQNGMPRKSISCPTLSELLFLGIDVYNDPQLGRPRARRGRRGSMGRQYESQDLMLESCTGAEDDGTREGLGSRSTLRMLKHTSYTDDPSFARATSRSDLSQDRSEDATPSFLPLSQSDSGPQRGRDSPSVDIIHRRTPSTNFAHVSPRVASRQRLTPLQTQTPGTSSTTSPPQPKKRFGLAHIFQFFNFVLVCFVVLLVGILKIMFDVKLNRIPMPRAVREMAASLIDGVGLGEAANPVLSAEDDAQRRTTTPKAKAA